MFPRIRYWQLVPAIALLTAAFGFAGQQSGSPQSATLQKQPAAQASQSEAQPEAASESDSSSRHRVHFSLGPILVGGGYSYFSGPAFSPLAYGYPFWSYYGYAPFWDPGFYGVPPYAFNLGAENGKGEVKLGVTPKTADLFIDDAFAGSAASLKGSVWLSPGAYNMCFKSPGHSDFCQRVYVLSGKKLQIVAKLAPDNGPNNGPNNGPDNGKVKP